MDHLKRLPLEAVSGLRPVSSYLLDLDYVGDELFVLMAARPQADTAWKLIKTVV